MVGDGPIENRKQFDFTIINLRTRLFTEYHLAFEKPIRDMGGVELPLLFMKLYQLKET